MSSACPKGGYSFRAIGGTREVYLAGGRLNPGESLAVAGHSAHGFGWGDGGSGAAQLAQLRVCDRDCRYPGMDIVLRST